MNANDYLFLTGKLRYLQTKLPDLTDLERILDAPNFESALQVFYDTDYAQELLQRKPEEFEKVILDDLLNDKKMLFSFVKDKDLIRLILLEYDFHNLKIIFKEKMFGKNLDFLLLPLGFYEPDLLKKVLLSKEKIEIDNDFKKLVENIEKKIGAKLEPYKIEAIFDKEYFSFSLELAKRLNNFFIFNFIRLKIDLENLRIMLRLKLLQVDKNVFEELLIDGGNIGKKNFLDSWELNLEEIFKKLEGFFPRRIGKYFSEYLENKKFWLLEKRLFEEEIEYLRQSKFLSYGPEIVFAYFLAKNNANKNIRLLMLGKMNNIGKEILRERIRKNINY